VGTLINASRAHRCLATFCLITTNLSDTTCFLPPLVLLVLLLLWWRPAWLIRLGCPPVNSRYLCQSNARSKYVRRDRGCREERGGGQSSSLAVYFSFCFFDRLLRLWVNSSGKRKMTGPYQSWVAPSKGVDKVNRHAHGPSTPLATRFIPLKPGQQKVARFLLKACEEILFSLSSPWSCPSPLQDLSLGDQNFSL
jgi:hypothetical protein